MTLIWRLIHLHKVCSLLPNSTTEHQTMTTRYTIVSLQQFSQMFKTDNGYRSVHTLKTRGCRLTMAVWGCRLSPGGWHPFVVVTVTAVICPSSTMKTKKSCHHSVLRFNPLLLHLAVMDFYIFPVFIYLIFFLTLWLWNELQQDELLHPANSARWQLEYPSSLILILACLEWTWPSNSL